MTRIAMADATCVPTAGRAGVPTSGRLPAPAPAGTRGRSAAAAQGGRSGLLGPRLLGPRLLGPCLLGVLTLLPGVLHAQGAAAATEPKGMPQFDFGNPLLISQIVWGAVIFALFYVLAARWALPQMAVVIERRQELIAADLETARHAKGEADAALRELTDARRASHAEAQRAIDAATAQAKAEAAEATAAMNARLDAQLAEAEGRIAAARGQAMGALREVATETAQLVVSRLISRPADAGRVQSAVDAVLAERTRAAA